MVCVWQMGMTMHQVRMHMRVAVRCRQRRPWRVHMLVVRVVHMHMIVFEGIVRVFVRVVFTQ